MLIGKSARIAERAFNSQLFGTYRSMYVMSASGFWGAFFVKAYGMCGYEKAAASVQSSCASAQTEAGMCAQSFGAASSIS